MPVLAALDEPLPCPRCGFAIRAAVVSRRRLNSLDRITLVVTLQCGWCGWRTGP